MNHTNAGEAAKPPLQEAAKPPLQEAAAGTVNSTVVLIEA
jgi:hypothetical protein